MISIESDHTLISIESDHVCIVALLEYTDLYTVRSDSIDLYRVRSCIYRSDSIECVCVYVGVCACVRLYRVRSCIYR